MYQTGGNGVGGGTATASHFSNNNQQHQLQQQQHQQQQQQQPHSPSQQQQQQHVQQQQQPSQANGNGAGTAQLVYPALHLQPLNDTFAPKQISLAPPGPQNKIKIGRQTNAKTIPQPSNGYFDSKVLSRMHAEVWSQDGKVFIKDIKSSNGTFINGSRLSPEGQESDTFELHSDDMVEFGIDIVGEDNKTIIHHKVACRVFLVMTAEEALGLRHDFAALYRGGIAGSSLIHHAVGPGAEGGFRRSKMGGGTGGYGANAGGSSMMSFDHILHRLQAELQKSRETAGGLGSINTTMNDIGETLGGGLPPMQNPPYQHLVPSATDPAAAAREEEQRQQQASDISARAAELKALEEQVKETQHSLQLHIDRLSSLESRLDENEGIKADIMLMREQVRNARNEASDARKALLATQRAANVSTDRGEEVADGDSDVDDSASVMSVDTIVAPQDAPVGRGPIGVDEVDSLEAFGHIPSDSNAATRDVDLLKRLKEHIGPLAPADDELSALDRRVNDDEENAKRNEELSRRLEAMEAQLEKALELGRTLAGQHSEATDTVRKLEERIKSLETQYVDIKPVIAKTEEDAFVPEIASRDAKAEEASHNKAEIAASIATGGTAAGGILGILESKWGKWREAFEADFAKERAGLSADREELRRVVRMWDNLNQEVEDLVEGAQTDDGGASVNGGSEDTALQHVASKSGAPHSPTNASSGGAASSNNSKKKKKRKGGNASTSSGVAASSAPIGLRRTTGVVGLGASAELNRHLRSLIYTDDYNLLVRETHLDSDGSTSASSSASDTSRSATSKMTDDTSVGSTESRQTSEKGGAGSSAHLGDASNGKRGSGNNGAGAGGGGGGGTLDDLPDSVRKRAMAQLTSGGGAGARRKGTGGGASTRGGSATRWPDLGGGTGNVAGNGFDGPATLPVLGAAGVVIVGMTAWIMAGKGLNLGGPGGL